MSSKVTYSVPVPNSKTPGNTAIYRHPKCEKELKYIPIEGVTTLQESFLRAVQMKGKSRCLGTQNQAKTAYTWKTYEQVKVEAEEVGSGIINMNLAPEKCEFENYNLRLIGVYSRNRSEWLVLDIANCLYRAAMIPLYDTLGPESIGFVIGHSNIETLFLENKSFEGLWKTKDLHNLKNIVCFDNNVDEKDIKMAEQKGIKITTWEQLRNEGKQKTQPIVKVVPDDCFTFSYTSGTTGNPKGAMLSHKNLVAVMTACMYTSLNITEKDVHLSYLPLPHIFERLVVCSLLFFGAAIGFYGGDIMKMKDDLQILKPTLFVSVPRIYNKFYAKIKGNMDALTGCKKCLSTKATNAKMEGLKKNASYTSGLWDALVFKKTKAVLGGNVTRMLVGSAPISATILDFMKIAMCCPFLEGYGQTESTGASFVTSEKDPVAGHVGGPVAPLEFKLEDVPDMGCTSEDVDKETGNLAPRGEICIRGHSVFLGYFKDTEKTAETIDKDGWLHTGDVGTILPNGALKIIDRKKNIFKLSQGEYVSPEKVENIYVRARGVAEVFVHGESLQNYAVAIIVPDPDVLKEIAKELGVTGEVKDQIKDAKIIDAIQKNIKKLGSQEGLKGFEQAKRIHLEEISFAIQGVMTDTMKLKRHEAKLKFKPQIDAMYALGEPEVQVKAQPSVQKA